MLDPRPLTDNELAAQDANRDPLSGEPGAHPVGVGVGAAAGGIAVGAAVGIVAGPIGMAVGAAIGAIAGGLIGKSAGEMIDPTAEGAFWERRAFVPSAHGRHDEELASWFGGEPVDDHGARAFDDMAADLGWQAAHGGSRVGAPSATVREAA